MTEATDDVEANQRNMETVTVKSIGAPTPLIATGASSGELTGFRPALGSEHGHIKST